MRVSAGFWVTGLSGKTLIQTLPPRLMWRVMAIRAASIWRAVIHPGSRAWIPYWPKVTAEPPLVVPVMRPRCCLRWRTLRGMSMSVTVPGAEVGRLVVFADRALDGFFFGQELLEVGVGFLEQRCDLFGRFLDRSRGGRGRALGCSGHDPTGRTGLAGGVAHGHGRFAG